MNKFMTKPKGIMIPPDQMPGFRATWADMTGVKHNVLIKTWGGIGDQICAEPTLRWAVNTLGKRNNKVKVSLYSPLPELFAHLPFYEVFHADKEQPIWDDYYLFDTIPIGTDENLAYQFYSHTITHCVDFPSIAAFRFQLYNAEKEVVLRPPPSKNPLVIEAVTQKKHCVVVHAGRHWESKTFPVEWWDAAIASIRDQGLVPVLIGKDGGESQGYVATGSSGCLDLRDKCSLLDTVWMVQQMPVLFCNDSAPMHMAVTGDAFIGFVATAKHPDYIMHWRKGQWAWRQKDFGLGGMWELSDNFPDNEETIQVDKVDLETIKKWLPKPEIIGPWCKEKIDEYFAGF